MLENPRSPRVRAVAKLAKKAARAESGLFLLEGPQAVAEALRFRADLVVELFATPSALDRYPGIAEAAENAGVEVEFVTEEVLDSMADTVTPQGFVAVCHQFPTALKDIFAARPRSASGSSAAASLPIAIRCGRMVTAMLPLLINDWRSGCGPMLIR